MALTPSQVDTLRRLNTEGASLRQAARQLGVSPYIASTASAAAHPPILWDRSQTKAATAAVIADARARRAALHARALDQLEAAMDDLDNMRAGQPYRTILKAAGGAEEVVTIEDGAVIQDVKLASATIREATTVEKNLTPQDNDASAEAGKSLVGDLMDALRSTRP